MILLIDSNSNNVLGVYSDSSYTPERDNSFSVRYNGTVPSGTGTLFYDEGKLHFKPYQSQDYVDMCLKISKDAAIKNILVNYNGVEYQGDEVSQDRLSRAINCLPENGTIEWKAKDNSKQILTKYDLKEILYLAGQEQTRIWFN